MERKDKDRRTAGEGKSKAVTVLPGMMERLPNNTIFATHFSLKKSGLPGT
jgi:hypothetical protein